MTPAVKFILSLSAVLLLAAALVPLAVVWIEYQQAAANERSLSLALPESDARTAVLVFSRSGNTAVLAHHIAQGERAHVIFLEAADYRLGLMGWLRALKDARSNQAVITPVNVDLSAYDRV